MQGVYKCTVRECMTHDTYAGLAVAHGLIVLLSMHAYILRTHAALPTPITMEMYFQHPGMSPNKRIDRQQIR